MRRILIVSMAMLMAQSAFAYTVTSGAAAVGDAPSRFVAIGFPASRFAERPQESVGEVSTSTSSFALKSVESSDREKTESQLTALGARQEGDRIIVSLPSDVLFDFDKSDIRPDAQAVLIQLSGILKAMRTSPVAIAGHTDSKGSDAYNQALSERRATSVRQWLVKLGIEGQRMSTSGAGETTPVAPNENADGSDNPDGRQKNRRVEFIISTGA